MAKHLSVTSEDDVLDIGTGSGILAITAGEIARKVVAVDINPQAVRCARLNVARNGMTDTISVLQGDLFSSMDPDNKFDIILFSPPYLEGQPKSLIDQALFDPDKSLVRRFLEEAGLYLNEKGYIQMVRSLEAITYIPVSDPAGAAPRCLLAICLLQAGADIIRMRHPRAVATVKNFINQIWD